MRGRAREDYTRVPARLIDACEQGELTYDECSVATRLVWLEDRQRGEGPLRFTLVQLLAGLQWPGRRRESLRLTLLALHEKGLIQARSPGKGGSVWQVELAGAALQIEGDEAPAQPEPPDDLLPTSNKRGPSLGGSESRLEVAEAAQTGMDMAVELHEPDQPLEVGPSPSLSISHSFEEQELYEESVGPRAHAREDDVEIVEPAPTAPAPTRAPPAELSERTLALVSEIGSARYADGDQIALKALRVARYHAGESTPLERTAGVEADG